MLIIQYNAACGIQRVFDEKYSLWNKNKLTARANSMIAFIITNGWVPKNDHIILLIIMNNIMWPGDDSLIQFSVQPIIFTPENMSRIYINL